MSTKTISILKNDLSKKITLDEIVKGIASKLRKSFSELKRENCITQSAVISPNDYAHPHDNYQIELMARLRLLREVPTIDFGDSKLYELTSKAQRMYDQLVFEGFYQRKK